MKKKTNQPSKKKPSRTKPEVVVGPPAKLTNQVRELVGHAVDQPSTATVGFREQPPQPDLKINVGILKEPRPERMFVVSHAVDQATNKEGLPPGFHECIDCHEDQRIVSHRRCNKCHLRWKREQDAQYRPKSTTNRATGYTALGKLHKLMDDCKVTSPAKDIIKRAFLPFTGLPEHVIKAELETLDRTAEEEDLPQS